MLTGYDVLHAHTMHLLHKFHTLHILWAHGVLTKPIHAHNTSASHTQYTSSMQHKVMIYSQNNVFAPHTHSTHHKLVMHTQNIVSCPAQGGVWGRDYKTFGNHPALCMSLYTHTSENVTSTRIVQTTGKEHPDGGGTKWEERAHMCMLHKEVCLAANPLALSFSISGWLTAWYQSFDQLKLGLVQIWFVNLATLEELATRPIKL